MKKLVLAASILAVSAVAASAADMAPRYAKAPMVAPVLLYDWSGFYVGLNGGWGSSRKCWDETNDVVLGPQNPALREGCHDASGGTFGGQVGYRWQSAAWVFGVEAQGNWADFKGSNVNLSFPTVSDRTKIDAFGLFTGQVGYAMNNALLYVKGGAAVTSDKYSTIDIPTGLLIDTAKETRWGAVVGVGIEYGFSPNWSVAFEYDHMFMGTKDVTAYGVGNFGVPAGTFSATDRIRQDVDLVTARVQYHFGGPVVARY